MTTTEIDNLVSFRTEAMSQLVCAWCQKGGLWEPHHVVYLQHCREFGIPQFSPRNALRVCAKLLGGCHERQHSGNRRNIPLAVLRDENIIFAEQYLGSGKAYNYLTRHYSGEDPRVTALLERA